MPVTAGALVAEVVPIGQPARVVERIAVFAGTEPDGKGLVAEILEHVLPWNIMIEYQLKTHTSPAGPIIPAKESTPFQVVKRQGAHS